MEPPITGQDQSICVVDTGVDFSHPDLAASNVVGCNVRCVGLGPCTVDCDLEITHSHGTYVAGVIASSGNAKGVAPSAGIVSIFAHVGGNNIGLTSARKGFDWCVDNAEKYNITVISLSFGSSEVKTEENCHIGITAIAASLQNAVDKGLSWWRAPEIRGAAQASFLRLVFRM
jgi:subtilisin family serine protease